MKKIVSLLFVAFVIVLSTGCGKQNSSQVKVEPKYGDWEICDYLNDFDEPTGKKYVRQVLMGDFSNSATASSSLRVIVFIYKGSYRDVDGEMRFDEYCNGVQDLKIWGDASPAKSGKFIDKANRKAFYYKRRESFRDSEDKTVWYPSWIDVFRATQGTFSVTLQGEYKTEYRFVINTEKLDLALKDAGIIPSEVE